MGKRKRIEFAVSAENKSVAKKRKDEVLLQSLTSSDDRVSRQELKNLDMNLLADASDNDIADEGYIPGRSEEYDNFFVPVGVCTKATCHIPLYQEEESTKWTNKQRVLVFSSRGISFRTRHLMLDIKTLLPHCKTEPKMDRKDKLLVINEICEMKNCNKCLYFEGKKKQDVYLWASHLPKGPSVKFLVENVHTMTELKLTGNCLKNSRPLLSFDPSFDSEPHWIILKELFIQIFGIPNHHPKSQPFTDHVLAFSIHDQRIWFRNYQILAEDGSLAEIGPRFVLNPIRIFAGSFGGATLYQNPYYVSPNEYRRSLRKLRAKKYNQRLDAKISYKERKPDLTYDLDPTDQIFQTISQDGENKAES